MFARDSKDRPVIPKVALKEKVRAALRRPAPRNAETLELDPDGLIVLEFTFDC